jgi:putative ABC transport system permease protein
MFKNYLKIAFRNLGRNKSFSIINILGLSIGMASAILILLWIQHELNFDQFHENKDRIYQAWNRGEYSGKLECWSTTPKVLASAFQRDNPEVERTARVNWYSNYLFTVGEKKLTVSGNIADSGFLQIFSYPLIKGNSLTALNNPNSIILTEKLAAKIFDGEEAMGRIIKIDNKDNFTVTGILKDIPDNSKFNFEYLIPWSYLRSKGNEDENWENNTTSTYVLLKSNTSLASIAPRLREMRKKYVKEDQKGEFFLYPISRWRLYSKFENGREEGGLIEFVKLFGIVAGFILLIACINFMNLSTARSEKRAKEVGIRKVVGAQKHALISQFLGESILISFIAGILALFIVQFSLPSFNQLTEKVLFVDYGNARFWLYFLGFIIFTGLMAGSYPAFFLSSFQPVKVLKGSFRKVNALITPRKILVVLQFTFAITLIICTLIVRKQIQHARDRETGYSKKQLVYHFLTGDLEKNYPLVKNELLNAGIATSVSKTSAPLTQGWSNTWGFDWVGKDPNDKTLFDRYCVDDNLVKTAGFQLVKGRDFNLAEFPTDSSALLLNESAVKTMGFKEPLGQVIKDYDMEWHVVGVIKDFILASPYYPTQPMVIEGSKGWFNVIHFRLNDQHSTADNLAKAEIIFKKYNPEYPFDFKFIDDEYAAKFKTEKRISTLAALFAGLTIFISCLGLFALATYMAENRVKEIGIRKVLGASVTQISALLSKDFLKLVVISFVIAAPLAWWAMHAWLEGYPYRTDIPVWIFVVAGILSIMISLITVSTQAIKAALRNPVTSLRTE